MAEWLLLFLKEKFFKDDLLWDAVEHNTMFYAAIKLLSVITTQNVIKLGTGK